MRGLCSLSQSYGQHANLPKAEESPGRMIRENRIKEPGQARPRFEDREYRLLRSLREQVTDRGRRRQLVKIRRPRFLETELRRVGIHRQRSASRLPDSH